MDLPAFKKFNLKIDHASPCSQLTTFQLGGPSRGVIHCATPAELVIAVGALAEEKQGFVLFGGGSNLLVSDKGIDCFIIRYVSEQPIITRRDNELTVSGSTSLDALALYAAENSLEGLNCTTGIPGTVGGAVVGNAGAFGKQIGDVLQSVLLLNPQGKERVWQRDECGFAYRHSALKETDDIVVSAKLNLSPGDREILLRERREILDVRRLKHPDLSKEPCAGSFYRNIEPTSHAGKRQAAGWFLEEAGAKDLKVGGAYVYEKHANIIIKAPSGTSQDVYELSKQMAQKVKDKFALDLVREVRLVGEFQDRPEGITTLMW